MPIKGVIIKEQTGQGKQKNKCKNTRKAVYCR